MVRLTVNRSGAACASAWLASVLSTCQAKLSKSGSGGCVGSRR